MMGKFFKWLKSRKSNDNGRKTICLAKKSHKRCITALLASFVMVFLLAPIVYAATDGFIEPFLTQRKTVVEGKGTYSPNPASYPFNSDSASSIGFDSLYGNSRGFVIYKGEVPFSLYDKFPYRYYNGTDINGQPRPWSDQSNMTESDVVDDSMDPHLWAMTQSSDAVGSFFGSIGLGAMNGLHWLSKLLVDLSITVKSIDLSSILTIFDQGSGELAKTLSSIFLIDTQTMTLSPFMMFALLMFVVSLVAMTFKTIRGDNTVKNVLQEFGIFAVALLVAGLFFTPTNPAKISHVGIDFISSLSNELSVGALGDAGAVYSYGTGSSGMDNAATQKGLVDKVYIDSIIEAQFGYPVNDLYLVGPSGGEGGFGTEDQVKQAMEATFEGGNINSMRIATDTAGENTINNLGYYLWAANSSVAIGNDMAPFSVSNGANVSLDSNNRVLYVVDFLSNLREQNSGNAEITNKVDRIMQSLVNPNYGSACGSVFMSFLQNLFLALGLVQIALFCVLGQTIIIVGSFALVIMPAMLLFKGTRDIARRMVWTYLLAFFRFLIGSALFNALICVVVLLSSQGIGGMIISMILSLLMAKFGPMIIQEINMYISRTVGGRELGFVNRAYARAGRYGGRRLGRGKRFRFNPFGKKPGTGTAPGTAGGSGGASGAGNAGGSNNSGGTSGSGSNPGSGSGNGNSNGNQTQNQQGPQSNVDPQVDNDDGVGSNAQNDVSTEQHDEAKPDGDEKNSETKKNEEEPEVADNDGFGDESKQESVDQKSDKNELTADNEDEPVGGSDHDDEDKRGKVEKEKDSEEFDPSSPQSSPAMEMVKESVDVEQKGADNEEFNILSDDTEIPLLTPTGTETLVPIKPESYDEQDINGSDERKPEQTVKSNKFDKGHVGLEEESKEQPLPKRRNDAVKASEE